MSSEIDYSTINQDKLKNLTFNELKSILGTFGMHIEKQSKAKSYYVDLILKQIEGKGKQKGKSIERNTESGIKSINNTKSNTKTIKLTNGKDALISNSNFNIENEEGKKNIFTQVIKTQKLFLKNKRNPEENGNEININNLPDQEINHIVTNPTSEVKSIPNFNNYLIPKTPQQIFGGYGEYQEIAHGSSNQITQSQVKMNQLSQPQKNSNQISNVKSMTNERHHSSNSLKYIQSHTRSRQNTQTMRNNEINDAFNNTRIELNENKEFNPFKKEKSNISVSHHSYSRYSRSRNLKKLSKNSEFDLFSMLKVIGGSLAVFGAGFYLFKFKNETCFNLENIIELVNKNLGLILTTSSALFLVVLVILIFYYYKKAEEYKKYCMEIAERCYERTINYFETNDPNEIDHINEEYLVVFLSKQFKFNDLAKFRKDIFELYVVPLLSDDMRFKTKTWVDESVIKTFWVYSTNVDNLSALK